jgi:hypothetical protein
VKRPAQGALLEIIEEFRALWRCARRIAVADYDRARREGRFKNHFWKFSPMSSMNRSSSGDKSFHVRLSAAQTPRNHYAAASTSPLISRRRSSSS